MDQTNDNTQTKKPYNPPQLIEHGTVEEITGFFPAWTYSGPQHTY
jgi:hypothetical protein